MLLHIKFDPLPKHARFKAKTKQTNKVGVLNYISAIKGHIEFKMRRDQINTISLDMFLCILKLTKGQT